MYRLEKFKFMKNRKYNILIVCVVTIVSLIIFYQYSIDFHFPQERENVSGEEIVEVDEEKRFEYLNTGRRSRKMKAFSGEILVHLDLKGAPPRITFLDQLFPYLKGLGATGILIEYEDMFPYSTKLDKAENAYSLDDVREILEIARLNGLQVIPLIQTFGHLEFLLKLEKFKSLREVPEYPQVICPTNENATMLIRSMVDEVLAVHSDAKYIHIGCDEVYYVGRCSRCGETKRKRGWSNHHLLLNHIRNIAEYVRAKHKGVRPIIWGDMFMNVEGRLIYQFGINDLVDIMVWHYTPAVAQHLTNRYLENCAKYFKSIWIAGAFKGATGADQIITDSNYHLFNLRSWMDIVSEWSNRMTFKGICLTGWQRYDHFSVLCELLPVSVPSLIRALQYLKNIDEVDEMTTLNILQCNGPLIHSPLQLKVKMTTVCNFPGFLIYKEITNFFVLVQDIKRKNPFLSANGWFSTYNLINKFSSPAQVENFFQGFPIDFYVSELEFATDNLKTFLADVYDYHTVNEWITTYVSSLQIRLRYLLRCKSVMLAETVWPRRPLTGETKSRGTNLTDTTKERSEWLCALFFI